MGMRASETSIASFFAVVRCCKSKSLSNLPIPLPLSILSHSLLLKVNKVNGLAGPFTMQLISTWPSKPFLLASGLPEVTTLPIAGHLPLITTSYSAWPSLIIQPIPFAVFGMRMCACMRELGHRALAPEYVILT